MFAAGFQNACGNVASARHLPDLLHVPLAVRITRSSNRRLAASALGFDKQRQPVVQAIAADPPVEHPQDPFLAATLRLQQLLENATWDFDDEIRHELNSYPVDSRLTFFTNIGSVVMLSSFFICWATNENPFGGATFSQGTLDHLFLGLGFGAPLLVCSLASRAAPVRQMFPILEDLHHSQRKLLKPLVSGLNFSQLLIVACATAIPLSLFLMPAMHGMSMGMGGLLAQEVLQPLGVSVAASYSREIEAVFSPVFSAYVAAWLVTRQLAVKHGEFMAIKDALVNSDRFFKLKLSMEAQREDSALQSQQASDAFKAVAVLWLLMKRKVCQLGFVLTALNVAYLGIMWGETHNLAAPVSAAVAWTLLELILSQRALCSSKAEGSKAQQ